MSRAVIAVTLLAITSCGPKTQSPAPAEPTTPEPAAAETPWADKSEEDKKKHMKEVVVPAMKAVFATAPEDAPDRFNCAYCHGDGVKDGNFEMPNAELEALDPADNFAAHRTDHNEMVDFMMQKVVPEMAQALGVEPFDPAKGSGFGCFACHTMKK
jgi:hypothetical protein